MALSEEARLNLIISAQNRAAGVLQGLGETLVGLQQRLFRLGEIAAGGWVFKDIVNSTQSAGMQVLRLSQDLGIAAKEASKLRFAAEETGVGVDTLTRSMGIFAVHLKEIGGKMDPFAAWNVSVTDAQGRIKGFNDVLGEVAERFRSMPDSLSKLQMSRELFGRGGEEMIKFLNRGKEGIRELGEEAQKLGLVFDTQGIQSTLRYTLAMRQFHASLEGLKIQVGQALLPVLTRLATGFTQLAQEALPWIRRGVEVVTPIFQALWTILSSVANLIVRIVSSALSTAQGMGIMASGTKAASNAFQWLLHLAKDMAQHLERLRPLGETVGRVLTGMAVTMKDEWAAAGHVIQGVVKALFDLAHGDFRAALQDLQKGFGKAGQDIRDMAEQTGKLPPGLQAVSVALGTIGAIKIGGQVVEWLSGVWKWAVALVGGGAVGGLLGQLAAGFSLAAGAILGGEGLGAALSALGMGFADAGAAIVAALGGWPVLLAVGLAALGAVIVANLDRIKGFFATKVPEWGQAFADWTVWTWRHIFQWFHALPGNLVEAVGFVYGWLSVKIPQWAEAFTQWLNQSWTAIGDWFESLPGKMIDGLGAVATWLMSAVPRWKDAFVQWLDDTLVAIRNWFLDLPNRLLDAILNFGSWLQGQLDALLERWRKGVKEGTSAAQGGTTSGQGSGSGTTYEKPAWHGELPPGLQGGGHVLRGGLSLVGEAGPELLRLPTGADVFPLSGALAPSAATGGITVNVNLTVNGNLIHERDLKRQLTDWVKEGIFNDLRMQKQMVY